MFERVQFTFWITKYALTNGITKLELPVDASDDGYLSYIQRQPHRHHFYNSKEWHRTQEKAVIRAKEMQAAKLKSIDKQRARIATLKFEVSHD